MKKIVHTSLTLGLLVCVPAFADGDACQIEQLFSALRERSDFVVDEGAYEVDRSLLFYRFPAELDSGSDRVVFEVRLSGEPYIVEEVSLLEAKPVIDLGALKEASSADTVVEFLALHPAQRAQLRRMAAGGGELELVVRLAGEMVETLTFADFEALSDALREDMPAPHAATSRLTYDRGRGTTVKEPLPLKLTCQEQCVLEQDYCENNCGGDPDCYDYCDYQYQQCLSNCTCTPYTNTFTSTQLVSNTPLRPYWECVDSTPNWPNLGPDWFQWSKLTYKITTTTVTYYADCTFSQSQSVSYQDVYCWYYKMYGPCPNPFSAINIC